jgi:beta-N-acetylhexosaminidase
MTESKAMILGCSGLSLTPEEKAFYKAERPWGFILFGRNIGSRSRSPISSPKCATASAGMRRC